MGSLPVWGIATAVLVGVAGCQGEAPKLPDLPGTTVGPETKALLAQLTAAGFTIEQDKYEPVPARYLRAPVVAVKVGGESLAIWEYPNPGAAADDGKRVSPRGIDGNSTSSALKQSGSSMVVCWFSTSAPSRPYGPCSKRCSVPSS